MLSILIPTYNYNAYTLAETLEKQALATHIVFEIICVDDGSFSSVNGENQKISSLTNSRFIENKKNLGRDGNRGYLASLAQYDWLLFLDSDMMPSRKNFLSLFHKSITNHLDVIFGGIAYESETPSSNFILRWKYGQERESKSVEERQKHPYRSIIFGCFAIKKSLFLKVDKAVTENRYGQDTLFTYLLKTNSARTKHIDNPALHLGLDENLEFLKKSKESVETLFDLYKNKEISSKFTKLLKIYSLLNSIGLAHLFGNVICRFSNALEKNILSAEPSLYYFDLYRLGYMCSLKRSK